MDSIKDLRLFLREKLESGEVTQNSLAKQLGITQAIISRFSKGATGIDAEAAFKVEKPTEDLAILGKIFILDGEVSERCYPLKQLPSSEKAGGENDTENNERNRASSPGTKEESGESPEDGNQE